MTTAQYQHQQVLLALATPGTPRRVSCRCGYTENDIQIGRAREAQLIAEAERFAAATNQEQLRRWAANRAAVRARLSAIAHPPEPRKSSHGLPGANGGVFTTSRDAILGVRHGG